MSSKPIASPRSVFTVRRCNISEMKRGTAITPRADVDVAAQQIEALRAGQQRGYEALLGIFKSTCANKESHVLFLHSLIDEAYIFQKKLDVNSDVHKRTTEQFSKSTIKELHSLIATATTACSAGSDNYVRMMGRLAAVRLFSRTPRHHLIDELEDV